MRCAQVGQVVRNESVLLVGSVAATIVGKPLVSGAYVEFTVEEHPLADKVIVYKKNRRKGYQRWRGYRAPLSLVRIGSIQSSAEHEKALGDRPGWDEACDRGE